MTNFFKKLIFLVLKYSKNYLGLVKPEYNLGLFKAGFLKVGQMTPFLAMIDTQGATSSKGVKVRAMRL